MRVLDIYFIIACFRKLEDGDIVNVDVTVYYKGVHGKRTFLISYIVSCLQKVYNSFFFP